MEYFHEGNFLDRKKGISSTFEGEDVTGGNGSNFYVASWLRLSLYKLPRLEVTLVPP